MNERSVCLCLNVCDVNAVIVVCDDVDASMKTMSGLSLNHIQYSGPNRQGDLFNILLRFRMHKYVFKGDVSKMYGQILVNKEDHVNNLSSFFDYI